MDFSLDCSLIFTLPTIILLAESPCMTDSSDPLVSVLLLSLPSNVTVATLELELTPFISLEPILGFSWKNSESLIAGPYS